MEVTLHTIHDHMEDSRRKHLNLPTDRRYTVVLPLLIEKNQAIPIPFILDTGAPEFAYMCSAAVRQLEQLNAIRDVTGLLWPYQLLGTLGPEQYKVHDPFVDVLPIRYEERIPGDVRANLLGIKAINHFELLLLPNTIRFANTECAG